MTRERREAPAAEGVAPAPRAGGRVACLLKRGGVEAFFDGEVLRASDSNLDVRFDGAADSYRVRRADCVALPGRGRA